MFYWASLCVVKVLSVGKSITHALKLFFSRFYGQHFCVGNSKDSISLFWRVFSFPPITNLYYSMTKLNETKLLPEWNRLCRSYAVYLTVLTAQCKEWTCRREVLSRIIFTVTILSEMSLPVKLRQYLLIQRIIPCYGWWPNTARFVE